MDENENIFIPKLIDGLNNIKSICVFTFSTYFLTNDGILYFCGYIAENNYEKKPKLLENNYKIEEIYSNIIYDTDGTWSSRAIATNFVSLFDLAYNQISKSKYKTIFDFFSGKFNISFKTIKLNENYLDISSNVDIKGLYFSPLTKS